MRRHSGAAAAVRILAGFFVAAGAAALVVGLHDIAHGGGRLSILFPAILLVVAGAVFLGAAGRLLPAALHRTTRQARERPPCREPVPVALLLTIILGAYIFVGAEAGVGVQRGVVIGVAALFVAVGVGGLAFFWSDLERSLPRIGAGIALGAAGLVVGAWEFWYQNQYIPSHVYRAVAMQVSLRDTGVQGRYDVLSATVSYEDVGSSSVVALGSAYMLTGSHVIRCQRPATTERERRVFAGQIPDPQAKRFMAPVQEERPPTVLAVGTLVAAGKGLAPNVPASRQLILYVPHGRYQLVRFQAQVFGVSTSVPLAATPPLGERYHGYLYDVWRLTSDGWFQDLLSGPRRWIVTRYEVVQVAGGKVVAPYVRVTARTPGPTWSAKPPSLQADENLFKPLEEPLDAETFADAELPLQPVQPVGANGRPPPGVCRGAGTGAGR